MRLVGDVDTPINPLPREGIFADGNMENISATIHINISKTQTLWKMYTSVQTALRRRLRSIQTYLRNSMTFFLGQMRRCQELIHQ